MYAVSISDISFALRNKVFMFFIMCLLKTLEVGLSIEIFILKMDKYLV